MINNEVGRDEKVHLSERDVIVNDPIGNLTPINEDRLWPQTKSDILLQEVQGTKKQKTVWKKIQGAIFPSIVLGVILGLVVMLFIINNTPAKAGKAHVPVEYTCSEQCSVSIVESIPENLTYPSGSPSHPSTFSAWTELITQANKTLHIAAFYLTLRSNETGGTSFPSDREGQEIFDLLVNACRRGVDVKIVQNADNGNTGGRVELDLLSKAGADVRIINFTRLIGNGILHTKFIISDNISFYAGSANMDWRALTQVKELGALVSQCMCPIVADLGKVFDIYWQLAAPNASIPKTWPTYMDTYYNMTHPLHLNINGNETAEVYISSSPPRMTTPYRVLDIDAILRTIEDAEEFVHIAVMDYFPTTLYRQPNVFWPVIDDRLRKVAFERKIKVKLLASHWNHTYREMTDYLRSLKDFSSYIEVKLFVVPTYSGQEKIPYARVNHNKYMVTDRIAYIGTSNWSGDYFTDTGGVGIVYNQSDSSSTNDIRQQLSDVFDRDWKSSYAHDLPTS